MKIEKTNYELGIRKLKEIDLIDISLSKNIIQIQTEKSDSLYLILRNQYLEWKKILVNMLTLSINKSIALHIMFLIIEIYIKDECVKEFNITNFTQKIQNIKYKEGMSYFQLRQIGHDINYFFNMFNKIEEYPMFTNLSVLLEIKELLDDLELPDNIKEDYMSLKYNCDLKGNYLCQDNKLSEKDIEKIKEVIDNVL